MVIWFNICYNIRATVVLASERLAFGGAIAAFTGIQNKRRYNQWLKSIVTFSQKVMPA